ncbi:MAG: YraN family protein [Flavobacteriales bacterium]
MTKSYELGIEGELHAKKYLKEKGYTILEERWHFGRAEIDIIAKRRETLYIIEVKTRSYDEVAKPEDAINFKKKKLLIEAANEYVLLHDLNIEVQFDVITLIKQDIKWKMNHIPDAFRPYF